MEFDENHKVKHWLLTDKEEAWAFIDFLEEEKRRHIKEAEFSTWRARIEKHALTTYGNALVEFRQSRVIRHNEDIEAIDKSIQEVKGRLGL